MTCKHCGKNIPDHQVRAYVYGLMGKASGKSKARDPEKMRAAALKRWGKTEDEKMPECRKKILNFSL
jgi:hypothetical protein